MVDRALLLVPPQGPKSGEEQKGAAMLKEIRERILMEMDVTDDLDSARELALRQFEIISPAAF
jgi:hypothetical protein